MDKEFTKEELVDLLYWGWTIIANATPSWEEDEEWKDAAEKWRDEFHQVLRSAGREEDIEPTDRVIELDLSDLLFFGSGPINGD